MEEFFENEWVRITILVVAVAIVTAVVVHLVVKLLKHVLMRESGPLPSSSIFLNIARALIWILALCVVLDTCFGINVSAVIGALGVGGIALSLGLQDTIANLVGGLQVSITKLIVPGDNIKIGGDTGIVEDITWRHVLLRSPSGEIVIVPNAVVNKGSVTKLDPVKDEAGSSNN